MRRALTPTVAVLAVLAQIALGAAAHLGLVLCIGSDHAAIESAADDCCASHGTVGSVPVATIARDCCSDIPLYSALRPLSELPRSYAAPTSLAAALPAVPIATVRGGSDAPSPVGGAPPAPNSVRRTIVLRV